MTTFKDYRTYAGLTQIECARILEISLASVQNYESGRANAKNHYILALKQLSIEKDKLSAKPSGIAFIYDSNRDLIMTQHKSHRADGSKIAIELAMQQDDIKLNEPQDLILKKFFDDSLKQPKE